ncbi:MAG: ABC transporter ATP-binding protein [Kiritimatiellae bacterium]|jgi:oligopeptide/dipeptide ABC transporter ATP-binding protein|nr:ABC transporter ATP-binding protein [Kiritimatiellia bacterium]
MREKILQVKNLSVEFETDDATISAVTDVSFDLFKGEILGIVGESGSGKSVSCQSILRLIPEPIGLIKLGTILFDNQDLLQISLKDLREVRGKRISMVFQEPMTALSPLKKIGAQLSDILRTHQKISKKDAMQEALNWLKKVGIPSAESKIKSYPYELSGGQRQRVMIAMALILEPDIIIADEPTTALDVTIQAQIFELIKELKADNTSIILITHDMGVINEMCDRVVVMYASEIVEIAEKDQLFAEPKHPYTQALLQSIPGLYKRIETLKTIPGQVPAPVNYGDYCRFNERCEFVFDKCRKVHPDLIENCRCWLALAEPAD